MTDLPAQVRGRWFYLYLILDLYSRKIVGWEVHDSDHADHAAHRGRWLRWSGKPANERPFGREVALNPERDCIIESHSVAEDPQMWLHV